MASREVNRIANFSPGPSCLPLEVLATIERENALSDWRGHGMGVMEMSHRGKHFKSIYYETLASLRSLIDIPDNYKLIFTTGGATLSFAQVPLNLVSSLVSPIDYLVTGTWGEKALKEGGKYGAVRDVLNLKEGGGYGERIPADDEQCWTALRPDASYLHYTSNETIHGVQWPSPAPPSPCLPNVPIVCDMSSDFASRPIEVSKFGVIYAGAQKNIGPAGVTICIVREDLLGKELKLTPSAMSWKVAVDNDSMYNTPPCWNIYVTGLVAKHLISIGGLRRCEELTAEKASKVYSLIDQSDSFYSPHVTDSKSRSNMNIVFRIKDVNSKQPSAELEAKFVAYCDERGIVNIQGHRSVGGLRVSVYNGVTVEAVEKLCEAMKDFQSEILSGNNDKV